MSSLEGYLAFVESRVLRGYMEPQALGRVSRVLRQIPDDRRKAFLGLDGEPAPLRPKEGPLRARVVSLALANAHVAQWHRHMPPAVGHKFSMAIRDGCGIRGVAIIGRPVARMLDRGETLEVLRVATDGTRNACSALLGAIRREVIRRNRQDDWGVKRIITYTLPEEGGASLRAAGWTCEGSAGGGSWSRLGRRRHGTSPTSRKTRWSVHLPLWAGV